MKSYGFKKRLVDSCQALGRSCQHLIFFSYYWESKNSAEKPVKLASTCSLFFSGAPWLFSAALKLFLGFSQQLQKIAKIQMFSTPCRIVTSFGLSLFKSLLLYQQKSWFHLQFLEISRLCTLKCSRPCIVEISRN
jgi:hypothetical protein